MFQLLEITYEKTNYELIIVNEYNEMLSGLTYENEDDKSFGYNAR
jgi:hypothetical protein